MASAQRSPYENGYEDAFFVQLEAYAKYGGEIKVIDGLTGREYHSSNEVVKSFYNRLPKIMGGFHNMLLAYESKNIDFRIGDGQEHEKELSALAATFGIKGFRIDRSQFLNKEKTIYSRLRSKPFFHIDELIVWDLRDLDPLDLPDNKYAENIRYDSESKTWHRCALTHWIVDISGARNPYTCNKFQGLDLDTQSGFHELDIGLPGGMQTSYFKDVKLSYPIFIDRNTDPVEQVDYLQRSFIENLRHLYDPFSWVTRRYERFQIGFASSLREDLSERSYKVKNRQWFDPVFATFLNDVITVKRHGYESIYREIAIRSINETYDNQLGLELDLLNWNSKETRVVEGTSPAKGWNPVGPSIKFEMPVGARFILLDAYLRNGDKLVETLREELKAQNKKEDAIPLFKRALEKTSGIPIDKYIKLAFAEQRKLVAKFQKEAKENSSSADLSQSKR
jgi:hypothetical protein